MEFEDALSYINLGNIYYLLAQAFLLEQQTHAAQAYLQAST